MVVHIPMIRTSMVEKHHAHERVNLDRDLCVVPDFTRRGALHKSKKEPDLMLQETQKVPRT